MRVLLDECLPRRLKGSITGHEVLTVPEVGWAGKNNGDLLRLAYDRFDVFVTVDRNLPAQRRRQPGLAIVILVARSNRDQDVRWLDLSCRSTLARGSRDRPEGERE